jgi:DNA-binding response OmpR family regulator
MAKYVLMIEDDAEMLMLGKIILDKGGYGVLTATNGPEGLAALAENKDKISLILLDIMLPGMYGWEILRTIKVDESVKHIPVIMLTSVHYLDDQGQAAEYAELYSDYVVKPFVVRDLLDKIDKGIQQAQG